MSNIRRFDHVGITVDDLDSVTAFFGDSTRADVLMSGFSSRQLR